MPNMAGSNPDQLIPAGMLGGMALQCPDAVTLRPGADITPSGLGDMCFQLTNDTTLVVKVRGSDGVLRTATLTLA